MKRTIKKGKHAASPRILPFLPTFKRVDLKYKFTFTESCIYDFGDNDNWDKNKLFGISESLLPRIRKKEWLEGKRVTVWFKIFNLVIIRGRHWDSTLWAWNCEEDKISLHVYQHIKGGIETKKYKSINIGQGIELWIMSNKGIFCFYLDMWFGGNRTAPHDIIIEQELIN